MSQLKDEETGDLIQIEDRQTKFGFIARMDLFGQSIQLMRNGEEKFQTNCGGISSVIVIFIVLGLCISSIFQVINYTKLQITQTEHFSLSPTNSTINTGHGFNLLIGFSGNNYTMDWAKPHILVNIAREVYSFEYNSTTNTTKYKQIFEENIPLEECREDHFQGLEGDHMKMATLPGQLCMKNNLNFEIGGEYGNTFYSFIRIKLYSCDPANIPKAKSYPYQGCNSETQIFKNGK